MIRFIKRVIRYVVLTLKNIFHLNSSIHQLEEKVMLLSNHNEQLLAYITNLIQKLLTDNADLIQKLSTDNADLIQKLSTDDADLIQKLSTDNTDLIQKLSTDNADLIQKLLDEHNNITQKNSTHNNDLIEKVESIKYRIDTINDILHRNNQNGELKQSACSITQECKMLEKANMNALIDFLFNTKNNSKLTINMIGHYSKEMSSILDEHNLKVECFIPATIESILSGHLKNETEQLIYPDAINNSIKIADSLIITNPAIVKMLLKDYKKQLITNKVKSELILFVPNSNTNEDMSIVWGNGFSGPEKSENNIYHRWYIGIDNKVSIYICNSSSYKQKCNLSFYVNSLDVTSQISISMYNYNKVLNMSKGFEKITFETYLIPGENEIIIEYFGKDIILEEYARRLKFSIADLNIIKENEINISGINAYKNSFEAYNPYSYVSDEFIRSILHSNGFFEIESFISSKNKSKIESIAISRYLDINQSYYFVNKREVSGEEGVRIYVARRKGELTNE